MIRRPAPSVADLVLALIGTDASSELVKAKCEEQGRVAVQAWSEALLGGHLAAAASSGASEAVAKVADAPARGEAAGRVPKDLDPADGARFVSALVPGLLVQRAVLGLDTDHVARAATALLSTVPGDVAQDESRSGGSR